ncbi:MAG: Ig-like domain-containing protein, partial [Anaerolineae bacterium]|nr:Ig-like domain-containing protein [Anaerolineae bacterium]
MDLATGEFLPVIIPADWVTQETRSISVDTRAPLISGSVSGTSGTNGWYTSTVTLTATTSDPTPGSGIDSFTYALNTSASLSTGGGPALVYSAPLTLTDGQHSLTLIARDKAGLENTSNQTLKVDTIPPSLQILTTIPAWVQETVTLQGTASDGGSGLQRVEISFNNGQTWQAATGTASWTLVWDTRSLPSGARTIYVKSVDMAGLSTIVPFAAQIDNTPPQIDLPGQWDIWDAVTFDARDADSGLESAELVISDLQNRWPKRVYNYAPGHLPLTFQWDRRFGDGTLAPMGSYDVNATATDRMGNTRKVTASIRILVVLLPPAISTPIGTPLPTSTPTATSSVLPLSEVEGLMPTYTPTSGTGVIVFGATDVPGGGESPTATPTLLPRATPTESTFSGWVASLLNPSVPEAKSDSSAGSILWGAGALAAMAGMTAYYEQKRLEEEAARHAAAQAQFAAEQAEQERKEKAQAKVMAKLEQQWEEERREEQAYQQWKEEQATGIARLEQADVTEAERHAAYVQSDSYKAYQANMAAWQKQQEQIAWLENADKTEAERLAEYKATPEYIKRAETLAAWQVEQEKKKQAEFAAAQGKGPGLAAPVAYLSSDNPPDYPWWDPRGWPGAIQNWIENLAGNSNNSVPASPTQTLTSTASPTQTLTPTAFPTLSILPSLTPTLLPSFTATPAGVGCEFPAPQPVPPDFMRTLNYGKDYVENLQKETRGFWY